MSLCIVNRYQFHDDVITTVTDVSMPAPPNEDDVEAYAEWAYDNVYPLTGVGHLDGDSFYDVTVTACSDPALVGRQFEWGY